MIKRGGGDHLNIHICHEGVFLELTFHKKRIRIRNSTEIFSSGSEMYHLLCFFFKGN